MAALAGFGTVIKVTGTTTAMTGEAMTGTGAGPYQITDITKRVFDPDVAMTFYDGGTPIAAADLSALDPLFGTITFTGSKTGPITVDGSYLPTYAIAEGREFTLSMNRELLDSTVFHAANDFRIRIGGLFDAQVTLGTLEPLNTDMDTTGGSRKWFDVLINGTAVLVEISPGGDPTLWRGWMAVPSEEISASFDGLVEGSVSLELSAKTSTTGNGDGSWAFGT